MKKLVIAFASIALLFVYSCKKTENSVQSTTSPGASQNQSSKASDEFVFSYHDKNGNSITPESIDENLDYFLIVNAIDDINVEVTYFENEDEAYNYCVNTSSYPDLKEKIENVRLIRDFAALHGVDFESDENVPQEVLDYIQQFSTGNKSTGVGILWEHCSCPPSGYGSVMGISGNPQFSLFWFNNRSSAAQGIGLANVIWDKKWFKGAAVYLLLGTAKPVPLIPNCGLNFNDRAESAW